MYVRTYTEPVFLSSWLASIIVHKLRGVYILYCMDSHGQEAVRSGSPFTMDQQLGTYVSGIQSFFLEPDNDRLSD